jgi:hypothetical protein
MRLEGLPADGPPSFATVGLRVTIPISHCHWDVRPDPIVTQCRWRAIWAEPHAIIYHPATAGPGTDPHRDLLNSCHDLSVNLRSAVGRRSPSRRKPNNSVRSSPRRGRKYLGQPHAAAARATLPRCRSLRCAPAVELIRRQRQMMPDFMRDPAIGLAIESLLSPARPGVRDLA